MSLEFEWDEAKAERNYAKHGVAFHYASKAFFDKLKPWDRGVLTNTKMGKVFHISVRWFPSNNSATRSLFNLNLISSSFDINDFFKCPSL